MHLGMQQILSTSMQQRQQLVMTPAMVQAIRLLQLNAMELEQEVVQELEENPFLELADDQDEEDGATPPDGAAEDSAEDQAIPAPTEAVDDGLGEVESVTLASDLLSFVQTSLYRPPLRHVKPERPSRQTSWLGPTLKRSR